MTDPQTPAPDLQGSVETLTQEITQLKERVGQLENKLLLLPDVDRYGRLQTLLLEGQFKAADAETTQIILDTVGMKRDDLGPEAMLKFPCTVLTVIDRLWRVDSQDQFGFSQQLQIYQASGGTIDTLRSQDRATMRAFAEQVGWFVDGEVQFDRYDQWDFSLAAPRGMFPAIWWKSPYGLKMVTFFFTRLLECRI